MIRRAEFPKSDWGQLREFLPSLVPVLEARPGWYGSLYLERKAQASYLANLKSTQASDQQSQGLVLRIYDGHSLYEQATDRLEPAALRAQAEAFAARVARAPAPAAAARAYAPPTWAQRLSHPLDPEIVEQIPAGLASSPGAAGTPVHFGIRYERDPRSESAGEVLARLTGLLAEFKRLAPEEGLAAEALTYVMARQTFAEECSLFVDRESVLSQTLLRIALSTVIMSGSDQVYNREGGLGGLECVELAPARMRRMLNDLARLKTAERLAPGPKRVILSPSVTGVLAHEAFGHSQEGDTCARGRSKAWDLHHSGEPVGNAQATILNNPALYRMGDRGFAAWGSYFFDEEGWLASEQVLLDGGKLRPPMTNLTSALRLEVPRSANGKRESWANGVYTRQTNTYFSPGKSTLDELVAKLDEGFIAVTPAGGMEDPKGMGIQVGISYLEEVKGGKRTGRLFRGSAGGDIQMTGYTPDILNAIVDKSKIEADSPAADVATHPFNDAGGCGKYHKELVYAGCGGTYMLLDGVTLG